MIPKQDPNSGVVKCSTRKRSWMTEWDWLSVFVRLLPGDRLRGSEEELAGAVGAVGADEGDSDWIQDVTEKKQGIDIGLLDCPVKSVLCTQRRPVSSYRE